VVEDVVVKSSRSLSHLLMSFLVFVLLLSFFNIQTSLDSAVCESEIPHIQRLFYFQTADTLGDRGHGFQLSTRWRIKTGI